MNLQQAAERAVIGALLTAPDRYDEVAPWLEATDFDGPGTNYLYISRSIEKLMDKRVEAASKK